MFPSNIMPVVTFNTFNKGAAHGSPKKHEEHTIETGLTKLHPTSIRGKKTCCHCQKKSSLQIPHDPEEVLPTGHTGKKHFGPGQEDGDKEHYRPCFTHKDNRRKNHEERKPESRVRFESRTATELRSQKS